MAYRVELSNRAKNGPGAAKPQNRSLRHLLYGNQPHVYRAIYDIDEGNKVVSVLTIRHGARDEAPPDDLS